MFPNIRAEMARNGLTASAMAEKLNLNERTLGNKLSGKSEFTWGEVNRIRSLFFPTCSLEYLFERVDQKTA
jgi:transcriptional regulator with XRE-family HTH domain